MNKKQIIDSFKQHEQDTGSTVIQIAVLTERIKELTAHLTINRKDFSTQRGLLKIVGRRRRLLRYLESQDRAQYRHMVERLGLRK